MILEGVTEGQKQKKLFLNYRHESWCSEVSDYANYDVNNHFVKITLLEGAAKV